MKFANLKNFRSVLYFIALSLVWTSAFAERISMETAQRIAKNVALQYTPNTRSSISLELAYTALSNTASTRNTKEVDFFVFNLSDAEGFIIVSGEDRVRPVLGYSFESKFDKNDIPVNLRHWLKGYQEEIAFAIEKDVKSDAFVQSEWESYLNGSLQYANEDGVLIETALWDQDDPYNRECPPNKKNEKTLTGCVATAMAIVMRHHQWPDKAEKGVHSYKGKRVTYENYVWENLPLKFVQPIDQEQGDAVADLMWNIGANVKMNYGSYADGGSGAFSTDAAEAFWKVFKYSKKTRYQNKAYFSDAHWKAMLKEELDQKRPIFYDGSGKDGGHAFVCDGYKGDKFHFNWGWSGNSNGYFLLNALTPSGGSGFNKTQGCIIVNKAIGIDDFVKEISLCKDLQSAKPKVNSQFPITVNFFNSGNTTITTQFAIGLVDVSQYKVIKTVSAINSVPDLQPNYGYYESGIQILVTLNKQLEENERLMLVYRTERSLTWEPVRSTGLKDRIGPNGPEKADKNEPFPGMEYYNIKTNLENITADIPEKIKQNYPLIATLKPAEGYKLPSSIKINMGGTDLKPLGYNYNMNEGTLTILKVTGDLVITASGIKLSVANETISSNETSYTISDEKVIIQTAEETNVSIYNYAGTCIFAEKINGHKEIPLSQGNYILKMNNKSYKIAL